MHLLIILCFLFTFTGAAATDDPNHISINCGGAAPATALSGRQWLRDVAPKGSSTTATVKGDLIKAVDPVPYYSARISRSQFSYSFHVTPGQKIIRLHFNPVSYCGFESFSDFFTVEAGPFTLLANFSASITARALAVNTIIKEFCVIQQENQPLNIVFSPETSFHSQYNYAFVNGIEIISIPTTISYCHGGGESGVHVLGKNYVIHLENTTALEMVHRQDIKWGSLNDRDGMFETWANKADNRSWEVSVDVGFRYLVRLHLCDQGLKMGFMLLINNMTALTTTDMLKQRRDQASLWYKNYMVMMEGHKREGKRMISICVHSPQGFLDRHGPLEGFEVFKLSNHDLSLASPNPIPPREDSPSQTIHSLLSCLGRRNAIAVVVFAVVCMVNIIVHSLVKMVEADSTEEEDKPCDRVKQHCRRFSLAELQSATQNFHDGLVIGRGGFGKVYRGFIDNGRDIVAIKRLKPDSSQGEHEFWTEVKTLSELRHVNLVSLIGYCKEHQEMMLVYEYMVYGTLADHLYKLSRKSNKFYHLSWKQRLKICIGAGRALDYLHTGHGIIHRDVKSSNILLDDKFVAKVSDLGLAKTVSGSKSESQDTTRFKGTPGYIDPNYIETHKLTKKSDTYAFGVVLLEVLCGRPAVQESNEEDKRSLAIWAIDNISKGQVDQIVTPSLRGDISPDSLKTFVKVAEKCLHNEPKKRPAMADVVIKLKLALQQQDKMESLALNETASVEDVMSCTDISQKENMNLLVPNENANDLPCNDRAIPFASLNVHTNKSPPREQFVRTMIDSGRKDGIKSVMLRITRRLWPQDAFWKARKPSSKTGFIGNSESAHRTSSITLKGNTISNKMLPRPKMWNYSPSELNGVTRNFKSDSVLGEGGFGKVYKDWLDEKASGKTRSGTPISVKRLNPESMQEFEEWQIEVNFLKRLSHPNLVRLLGYGWEDKELLLVYEDMPKGSLANHMFGRAESAQPFPRDIRLKIFIGAANGDILLDGSYDAKISDFGLAKTGPTGNKSRASTHIMETYGYSALEYVATGLRLRALDTNRPSGTEWIEPRLFERRKLKHIIDVRLEGRYPCQITLTCFEAEPKRRPSMQEVGR